MAVSSLAAWNQERDSWDLRQRYLQDLLIKNHLKQSQYAKIASLAEDHQVKAIALIKESVDNGTEITDSKFEEILKPGPFF